MKRIKARHITARIWVIVFIFLLPKFIVAQEYSIASGKIIRITAPEYFYHSIVGNFIIIKNDSLYFQINKRLITIPLQQVTKLEVARGKKSNTKKGAIIGGIAGGLGLGVIAAIDASDEQDGGFTPTPGQAFLVGLLSGSLIGTVTGTIIGNGSKSTRWVEVTLSQQLVPKGSIQSIEVSSPKTTHPSKNKVEKPIHQKRKWSLSFNLGTTSSGPAADIEKAMRNSNFDETLPANFFGGPVEHPFSKTGFGKARVRRCLQIAYRINRKFDGAFLISHNPIGFSDGYRSDPVMFLSLNYYSTIISPMIIYKTPSILQLGFGPGVCINKIEQKEQKEVEQVIYRQQRTRLCGVFQAMVLFPQRTRFFLKLDAQYRLLPKTTYGPFKAGSGNAVRNLESFEADFSHLFVGAGIGIRL